MRSVLPLTSAALSMASSCVSSQPVLTTTQPKKTIPGRMSSYDVVCENSSDDATRRPRGRVARRLESRPTCSCRGGEGKKVRTISAVSDLAATLLDLRERHCNQAGRLSSKFFSKESPKGVNRTFSSSWSTQLSAENATFEICKWLTLL